MYLNKYVFFFIYICRKTHCPYFSISVAIVLPHLYHFLNEKIYLCPVISLYLEMFLTMMLGYLKS